MAQPPVFPSPWAPPPAEPAPGLPDGLVIAGMWRRFGAYLLDRVILFVVGFGIATVMGAMGLWITRIPDSAHPFVFEFNYPAVLINTIVSLIVSAVYHVYMWTKMRATPGQIACNLQVGDVSTGNNLTLDQATMRWLALEAIAGLSTVFVFSAALYNLASLMIVAWVLALLITTASHPLRRGLHDRWAGSLVVWLR